MTQTNGSPEFPGRFNILRKIIGNCDIRPQLQHQTYSLNGTMPQNKRQHYVPRSYLKRFSPDGKSISIWNVRSNKKIEFASLRDQCYKDYFYGKELDVEKSLGENETNMGRVLEIMLNDLILPPRLTPDHFVLVLYIVMQYGRTKYSADLVNEMYDVGMRHRHRLHAKSKGIDIDQFKISIKNAPVYSLGITVQCYPLLIDLHYKLLINKTNVDFVTSDNPVVFYNQLFSFGRSPSNVGITQKGLQIFLPIGPRSLLVFYDVDVYSVGKNKHEIVDITLDQDVYELNTLQMCSALNCVYFGDKAFNIEALYRKASPYRREKTITFDAYPGKKTERGQEQILTTSRVDVRTNLTLSLLRLTKSARIWKENFRKRKSQPVSVLRNPALFDYYNEVTNNGTKLDFTPYDFMQFLKI